MKKALLPSLFFIMLNFTWSQEQKLNTNYKFNTIFTNNNKQFKPGYRIKVIKEEGNQVYFSILKFDSKKVGDTADILNKDLYETNGKIIEHTISKKEFEKYTNEIYPAFKGVRAGFYTIPYKLRFEDFDFEQNINFGMNIGFQYRFNREIKDRWIYEPSFGIGLSSINLNSKNSSVEKDRTASAFTLTSGVIFHFDTSINLGIFAGFDFLGNNDQDINWKFDSKPWLGIGINIGFSISESKDNNLKNIVIDD